jgi:hypothetical protein
MPVTPKHSSKQVVIASYLFLVTLFSLPGVVSPVLAHSARNTHSLAPFSVTSINATVSPTAYNCSQSPNTFNFNATINVSPNSSGGNITYTWLRSDGATMSPITIVVPTGQRTVTVTDTWTLWVGAPNGSYWEQVSVTAPNSITSNKATFTKSCSSTPLDLSPPAAYGNLGF